MSIHWGTVAAFVIAAVAVVGLARSLLRGRRQQKPRLRVELHTGLDTGGPQVWVEGATAETQRFHILIATVANPHGQPSVRLQSARVETPGGKIVSDPGEGPLEGTGSFLAEFPFDISPGDSHVLSWPSYELVSRFGSPGKPQEVRVVVMDRIGQPHSSEPMLLDITEFR